MKLSASGEKRLLGLIREGLESGARRLEQISGAPWEVAELGVRQGEARDMRRVRTAAEATHCGAIFSIPGGVFLLAFPEASAAAVAQAFFRGYSSKPQEWRGHESEAVEEIANIVVNPVANVIGDAALMTLFLSAPSFLRAPLDELDGKAFAKMLLREDNLVVRADIRLESKTLGADCGMAALFNSAFADQLSEAFGA